MDNFGEKFEIVEAIKVDNIKLKYKVNSTIFSMYCLNNTIYIVLFNIFINIFQIVKTVIK